MPVRYILIDDIQIKKRKETILNSAKSLKKATFNSRFSFFQIWLK